jgi:hypothetical protein
MVLLSYEGGFYMKKWSYLLALILVFSLHNNAEAHSGRTDSSGGHNCSPKSISKGLCTGYHYHNGGGSTNTAPAPAKPVYNPKVYYDSGYHAGYDKGHEMGYKKDSSILSSNESNSDYVEGWSAGYQKGLEDGLAKINKEEQDAKDKKDGNEQGKKDGATSFSDGKNNNDFTYASGSSELYISSYKEAFASSWQLTKSSKESYDKGYEQGLSQDEIVIPINFQTDILKPEYENGHKAGVEERDKNEMAKYEKEGQTLGYEVKELAVNADIKKEIYIEAFKKGYEDGLQKREQEVVKEGYNFAFKQMKFESSPYEGKEHFSEWFKKGYDSNDIAVEIKTKAIELGKENKEYTIPKKYKVNDDAIALYDKFFLKGQKIQEEIDRKNRNTLMTASVIGVPAVGGGIYFWKRKGKKNIG